jgi:hypothetical protein
MPEPTVKYTKTRMTRASSRKNGKRILAKVVGANYVEEEKRLLGDQGVNSRFDT